MYSASTTESVLGPGWLDWSFNSQNIFEYDGDFASYPYAIFSILEPFGGLSFFCGFGCTPFSKASASLVGFWALSVKFEALGFQLFAHELDSSGNIILENDIQSPILPVLDMEVVVATNETQNTNSDMAPWRYFAIDLDALSEDVVVWNRIVIRDASGQGRAIEEQSRGKERGIMDGCAHGLHWQG